MQKVAEVFPPGEMIQDELEERGWSQDDLAAITGMSKATVSLILGGKRAITNDTAELLSRAFGTSAALWLNLEFQYRQSLKKRRSDPDGELRAKLFAKAPVREMVKRRWIAPATGTSALVDAVLKFFGRESLDEDFEFDHAARKSGSYTETTPAQCAWLHRARQMAKVVAVKNPWRASRMGDLIRDLQRLILNAQAVQELPGVMSNYGVRFVVVEPLPQAKMDGASFWLGDREPVIAVSLRFDRIDNFWHTTMHECGHIKHGDRLSVDVDVLSQDADKPEAEKRADAFAVTSLVPPEELDDFCVRAGPLYSTTKIIGFASRLRVHPGIVVGQLHWRGQERRGLDYSYFRKMLEPVRSLVTATAFTDGWGKIAPLVTEEN